MEGFPTGLGSCFGVNATMAAVVATRHSSHLYGCTCPPTAPVAAAVLLHEDDSHCPATGLTVPAVAALVTQRALLLLPQCSLLQQPLLACTAAFGAADT